MARNIGTRGMRSVTLPGGEKAVTGLKQLEETCSRLVDAMDGPPLQQGLGEIAKRGAVMLEANALAQGWPKDAVDSIFVYGQLAPNERKRRSGPSALFGFRKRGRKQPFAPGYREWFPGRSKSMRAKSLVIPGFKGKDGALQKIGMSLATMFEFGTSKMRARPALRQTIAALRAIYPQTLGALLQRIIARHTPGGGR